MIKKFGMILTLLLLVGCNAGQTDVSLKQQILAPTENKTEAQSVKQMSASTEHSTDVASIKEMLVSTEEQTTVYSFTGESENLSLYNGVIILSPTLQQLYSGQLVNNREDVSEVLNYTLEFFMLTDNGKEVLFTVETGDLIEDNSKERVIIPGVFSPDLFSAAMQNSIEDDFYFDITITTTNGEQENYQLKLETTKVTKTLNYY